MDALNSLRYANEVLQGQRFAGLDQNPKGIRDLLGSAVQSYERERKAAGAMLAALKRLHDAVPNVRSMTLEQWRELMAACEAAEPAIARAEAAGITPTKEN